MMNPPCTVMVERILPEMRKRVALSLKDRGWPQTDISGAVGVSQPMVSRYLSSEPEEFSEPMESEMKEGVKEIVRIIENRAGEKEIIGALCELCFSIRERGLLCEVHHVSGCRVCMNLRTGSHARERRELLNEVKVAVEMLEGGIPRLMIPEVRINIAAALSGAGTQEEVVAVPGRLVEINGELRALTEPEFGASRHLSAVLLAAMRNRAEIVAVINIAFNEGVQRALKNLDIEYEKFDGQHIPENWNSYCLLDPGAYGREPCLYVFGKSPVDAVTTVKKIAREVEP